ncbi:Seven_transmembrane protein 1 [Hexamita inflata]|uniref:Seven transmembrane protein 1 n=1 Tax=Hexamita inflata TaxID=28002 RepID=A0AA86TVQ3_9EUKA|nr:Seven transmembrane protein 1 [Hexamita inflata]
MVCQCQNSDYNEFIAVIFDQCYYKTKEVASFVFGLISMLSFLVAYFPQIRMNLKTKQSQGMSTAFLLLWGGADFCNFVAYFLLNGLLTQKLLGTALVLCNIILIVSHLRYKNNTQPRTTNLNYSPFEKMCFVFAIVLIVVNITWFYVFNQYKLDHEQNLPKCVDNADPSKVQGIIGQVFGYLAASLFVVANIPQIVKNFRLKSTLNISLGFSLCIACGNLTQTISSVSFSQEKEDIIKQIPFIISFAVPCVYDAILICQIIVYSKAKIINDRRQERTSREIETKLQTVETAQIEVTNTGTFNFSIVEVASE